MLFLWVFGDNVEDALGHFRFLAFYLLCAICGAAFHGFVASTSQVPLIGASGAIAATLGALGASMDEVLKAVKPFIAA